MLKLCIVLGVIAACYAETEWTFYDPMFEGGSLVEIGDFPYAASVQAPGARGRIHASTGSILNNRWILTTASRLKAFTDPRAFQIRLGTTSAGGDLSVEQRIEHPLFGLESEFSDLALLKVDRDIEFSETVRPIGFFSGDSVGSNLLGTLVGWGNTYDGSVRITRMYSIDLKTEGTIDGFKLYVSPVGDGVCVSDLGGPFVVNGELIGVSTLTRLGCGITDQYITRLDADTLEWINSVIA